MRKHQFQILIVLTLLFAAFTMGLFLGMNQRRSEITVSVSKEMTQKPTETMEKAENIQETKAVVFPISLNSAGTEELAALPGIGDVLAQRIVAYRKKHGRFKTEEELLNVEGIGKKRLEEILDLIVIGG